MSQSLSLRSFLQSLSRIHPPKTLLHIGEGRCDISDFVDAINPKYILTTIGNCSENEKSHLKFKLPYKYHSVKTVIAKETGETVFYEANLKGESGLVNPDLLKGLWENISTVKVTTTKTESLSDFMKRHALADRLAETNWLSIDSISSVDILRSAENLIDKFDVIIARTLIDDAISEELKPYSKTVLDDFFEKKQFKGVSIFSETLPAVGQVVFVKDWRNTIQAERTNETLHYKSAFHDMEAKSNELEALLEAVTIERNQIDKKLALSENNLCDLRAQHKVLSQNIRAQTETMKKVLAILKYADFDDSVPTKDLMQ